jgi:hypothetical protein
MTEKFDTLLEQMINEMMPADIEGMGLGGTIKHVKGGVPEGDAKGHWAPLQKLSSEDRETVLSEIFKEVFSEKENTYAPTVDNPKELHGAIQSAIQSVSNRTGLKASGKWAAKFLADRIMTLLKNNVKYTSAGGEETIQKEVTQKEFKQALNKALQDAPKEEPTTVEEPTTPEEKDENVETVYTKAADLDSDDADLQKAFNKLPNDKEMSWAEVLKTVGMSKGLALIDAGGLTETAKEVDKEQEYGSELSAPEFDEDENETRGYESEFDRTMRDIDSFRSTRSFDSNSWD